MESHEKAKEALVEHRKDLERIIESCKELYQVRYNRLKPLMRLINLFL